MILDFQTYLLTSFGPFGGHEYNPSVDVAHSLEACLEDKRTVETLQIPVTYATARQFREHSVWNLSDPLILQFGLGQKRQALCIEERARNIRGPKRDESDAGGNEAPLVADNDKALHTDLDTDSLVRQLEETQPPNLDIPVRTSLDAGSFVCNALYYHSLHRASSADDEEESPSVLFIHVPHVSAETAADIGRWLYQGFFKPDPKLKLEKT